jgi:hypothetical protein
MTADGARALSLPKGDMPNGTRFSRRRGAESRRPAPTTPRRSYRASTAPARSSIPESPASTRPPPPSTTPSGAPRSIGPRSSCAREASRSGSSKSRRTANEARLTNPGHVRERAHPGGCDAFRIFCSAPLPPGFAAGAAASWASRHTTKCCLTGRDVGIKLPKSQPINGIACRRDDWRERPPIGRRKCPTTAS